nr:hypothetical protein [Acinetobacter sp. Marseille-Q1620]
MHRILMLIMIFFPIGTFAQPVEISFKKQKLADGQIAQLCQKLPEECLNKRDWNWYKSQEQNNYYLISKLKLYQFDQNLKQLNAWNFSNYPQTQVARWSVDAESLDQEKVYIFPKLFPVNEHDYSVAIIQEWSETYSGGGLLEEVADFIQIKERGHYQKVFFNIPFSLNRMIRACFSEEDYKKAGGQCHDEYALTSWIEYVKPMNWKVKYKYQTHISKASDSNQKTGNFIKTYLLNEKNNTVKLPESWSDE